MKVGGLRSSTIWRVGAIAAAVGGFFFLSSRLQPPSRGTEYDKTLDQALERQPVMTRPRSDLPDYIRDPQAGKRKSEELILKSKGNFERLAPEEQSWLDSVTAGHGEVMVRKCYPALAAQAQREKQGAGKGGKRFR